MLSLESLAPGQALTGMEPAVVVTILAVVPIADGVVQVIYKTPAGVLKDRLLSRSDTDGIALATKARGGEPGASGAGL